MSEVKFYVRGQAPLSAAALLVIPIVATREQVMKIDPDLLAQELAAMAQHTCVAFTNPDRIASALRLLRDNWSEPVPDPVSVDEAKERGVVLT